MKGDAARRQGVSAGNGTGPYLECKNALITYKAYEQNKELVQHDIDSKSSFAA